MIDLLQEDLSNIKVPFHDVIKFMDCIEGGLVNSDNQDFYTFLNETENYDELFKNLDK